MEINDSYEQPSRENAGKITSGPGSRNITLGSAHRWEFSQIDSKNDVVDVREKLKTMFKNDVVDVREKLKTMFKNDVVDVREKFKTMFKNDVVDVREPSMSIDLSISQRHESLE